jgi:hypothetical protein
MEMICSSENSFDFQRIVRRYIPEDRILLNHRCENLKPYSVFGEHSIFPATLFTEFPIFALYGQWPYNWLHSNVKRLCCWPLLVQTQSSAAGLSEFRSSVSRIDLLMDYSSNFGASLYGYIRMAVHRDDRDLWAWREMKCIHSFSRKSYEGTVQKIILTILRLF